MTSHTRILIIRFSSIGDMVLTTPVVRRLKLQLQGETEIHYLTKRKFAVIMKANPYITKVHTIEKTVQEVLPELETIHFDYIIDLHRNIRSAVVKRRLKTLSFSFEKLNFRKWLWVNLRINRMPSSHVVDRYLDTIEAFATKDDGQGLDYFIPTDGGLKASDLPPTHQSKYIAIAIGGMHIGKKMSKEKLAALCNEIAIPIILLGGEQDAQDGTYIKDKIGNHVFNAAGKFSLHQSADCLRKAALVITGDTGMMHIAAAFGQKIITLWGCTVPGLGMSAYRADVASLNIEPRGLNKRPCSKLGNHCKYGESKRCIEHIENREVVRAINNLLQ